MATKNTDVPPISGKTWLSALVIGAGAFMAMLDSTVANLALESIRSDFSATLQAVQWVSTAYLCALAVSLPAAAWLGGRYGYSKVWFVSLAVFVAVSLACALAPESISLIAARIIQGLAGGIMVPVGQAIIVAMVSRRQLGRIFGLLGFVIALGPALGPAFSGLLLDFTSWRWLFWINVPIGITALLAARHLQLISPEKTDSGRKLDRSGLALLGIGLPLLLFGAIEIGVAETSYVALVTLIAGAMLTSIFVYTAWRKSHPLIDLHLFKRKVFCLATLTTGLTGANMYGGLLILPLYFHLVLGQGLAETGFWLLVMGLGSAVILPLAGAMTDRLGAGIVAQIGACLLFVSTLPFLFMSMNSAVLLGLALVVRGAGMALAQMPAMTAAYGAVLDKEVGDATTLVNIVQRIGGTFGAVAVVVVLVQTGGSSSQNAHFWAFGLIAAVSAITLFFAYRMYEGLVSLRP